MIRPNQSLRYIADLTQRIKGVEGLFNSQSNSLIFSLLADRMAGNFSALTATQLLSQSDTAAKVESERWLVYWYADPELWVEAVTLAREWVIKWRMLKLGMANFNDL